MNIGAIMLVVMLTKTGQPLTTTIPFSTMEECEATKPSVEEFYRNNSLEPLTQCTRVSRL